MDSPTNSKVNLGSIDKIPPGQGLCFTVAGEEIAVFRPRSGGLKAIQNRCPHKQGPLCEGISDPAHVICPYHGHKFDLSTGEGSEPGESVKVFQVTEEDGEIFLAV